MKKIEIELNNGVKMPMIGYGTWLVNDEECIYNALKTGYYLIDTAIAYNNEELVAQAIQRAEVKRDNVFIVTKIPGYDYNKTTEAFKRKLRKAKR